jgi:putative transposase
MSKSSHTEAQMIGSLKQLEAGRKAEDVAREVGVSKHTIYAWKGKYGGMDVSQAQEAKQRRDENTKLRKLVGGSESGQGSFAVGKSKKRVELVALKGAIEQVREEYAFSQRRACGLLAVAVACASGVSRGRAKPSTEEARALRARRTTAAGLDGGQPGVGAGFRARCGGVRASDPGAERGRCLHPGGVWS